eukprot:tig00021468_g21642.t1
MADVCTLHDSDLDIVISKDPAIPLEERLEAFKRLSPFLQEYAYQEAHRVADIGRNYADAGADPGAVSPKLLPRPAYLSLHDIDRGVVAGAVEEGYLFLEVRPAPRALSAGPGVSLSSTGQIVAGLAADGELAGPEAVLLKYNGTEAAPSDVTEFERAAGEVPAPGPTPRAPPPPPRRAAPTRTPRPAQLRSIMPFAAVEPGLDVALAMARPAPPPPPAPPRPSPAARCAGPRARGLADAAAAGGDGRTKHGVEELSARDLWAGIRSALWSVPEYSAAFTGLSAADGEEEAGLAGWDPTEALAGAGAAGPEPLLLLELEAPELDADAFEPLL